MSGPAGPGRLAPPGLDAAAVARRVTTLTGAAPTGPPLGVKGGEICDAYRVPLDDRRTVLAKTRAGAPADFFTAEATGLDLLRSTGSVAVPEVLAAVPDLLLLEWIEPAEATPEQAERLGRELAALHSAPAAHYGTRGPLYLGTVPMSSPAPPVRDPVEWPAFHAEYRLRPLLRMAVGNGGIAPADARDVERVCERIDELAGPPRPPAVIHGDLWAGNILWTAEGRPHLIDPSAQGGHPEADLAYLEVSHCPYVDRLIAAYEEISPLPGRAARVPLHQLYYALIHAALFGGEYGPESGEVARAALA